ncbi:MAG: Uma2 family endonuclease [Rubrivivax sp.]
MTTLTWADVMANPFLKDLPFKIELNKWGRIEMSPASNEHGRMQYSIGKELDRLPGGSVVMECSIVTSDGVRVADVAWVSDQLLASFGAVTPYPRAPEICVEIMSPSNTWGEMHMKAGLYLNAGASEVWIDSLEGERRVIRSE